MGKLELLKEKKRKEKEKEIEMVLIFRISQKKLLNTLSKCSMTELPLTPETRS